MRRGRGILGWVPGFALAAAAAGLALPPAAARAEDAVVFRDGQVVHVERTEVLPDRVRIQTRTETGAELPRNVPATFAGPRTVDVPREEIRAVLPVPDLPAAARPQAERYGDVTQQLTDQVRRDLQRSWSPPPPARR